MVGGAEAEPRWAAPEGDDGNSSAHEINETLLRCVPITITAAQFSSGLKLTRKIQPEIFSSHSLYLSHLKISSQPSIILKCCYGIAMQM